MEPHFRILLGWSSTVLALLTSSYLLGYALTLTIWGFIVDRVGSGRTLLYGLTLASISTITFSISTGPFEAILSRFLVGIGSASVYVSMVSMVNRVFNDRVRGFMLGVSNAGGIIGAFQHLPSTLHFPF